MTYAGSRVLYDADSHIMELPDFLRKYADPAIRNDVPEVSYSASLVTDEEVAIIMNQGGVHSDEHISEQVAMGDTLIAKSKEIQGLGAFNRDDRSVAMDMLGFKKQLVFATHSLRLPFSASSKVDPILRYGATRAHNRHMADFCGNDDRLMGVAAIPLTDPDMAIAELDWILSNDAHEAVWIPHTHAGGRSPGHVEFDPFWARLEEAGMAFVLHVGGAPLQSHPAWANTGRAAVKDWMGGGENLRAKDSAVLHHAPEQFLSAMVLDGVFERFPRLRGASVELGAGWMPEMLVRLDWTVSTFSRVDQYVSQFTRTPTEQLTQQFAVTPYVFEDVAGFIERSNDELYLFSSDYPHTEGGRDPIGRFEKNLGGATAQTMERFHSENFLRVFPHARVKVIA